MTIFRSYDEAHLESVSSQALASPTPHESQDGVGQKVAKRKSSDGGNMKKKVRFDVPATFLFSCPLSMCPGQRVSEDLFPNAVFSFKPPEPLLSQVSGEPNNEHEEGRALQEEDKENQQTTKTVEHDGENVPQEQPQDFNAVEGLTSSKPSKMRFESGKNSNT